MRTPGEILDDHLELLELKRENARLARENAELRDNVSRWKDSWFHLRDSLSRLWWHHPAIDDDAERARLRANLESLRNPR